MGCCGRVKAIVKGNVKALLGLNSDIAKQRKAICRTPEVIKGAKYNTCKNLKFGMCTLCGCPINSKTRETDQECPRKKWLKIAA